MEKPRSLRLHADDNLRVAITRVGEGDALEEGLVARAKLPSGHKIAARAIAKGAHIVKYGQPIGRARMNVAPGDWLHVHNVDPMPEQASDVRQIGQGTALAPPQEMPSFQGFLRENGTVGTRNYIGVLTSVNCAASVADFIASEAERSGLLDGYDNIDGIVPLTHGTGCGLAPSTEGYKLLERTLWGHAAHPNFAAILIVGLGCEVFRTEMMLEKHQIKQSARIHHMTIQEEGGTLATVQRGLDHLRQMLPAANAHRRTARPASDLRLGLQCGGSDGLSGVTANPALGIAADQLVAAGGVAVLSETPEIFGAEAGLMRRAVSIDVARALQARVDWWTDYAARHGARLDNNPSPGNKQGGLTTISEKSLGAVAKSGQSPLSAVIEYAEPIPTGGLIFMDSPGYDPVSVTGQVASGCNMVVFTTGRGSAFGSRPAPTIKVASNARLMTKMSGDMDVGCGDVLDGVPLAHKGQEIFDHILKVASGARTASERLGYGRREFVPWQVGAVL